MHTAELYFFLRSSSTHKPPNQLPADHHSSVLTCLVHFGDDGGADLLDLLLLVFKLVHLSQLVAIQPLHGLIHSLLNLALVL